MKVNLRDIARQLDVSPSTVSRSLRNDKAITPEMRARVHEAAQQMGYEGRARPSRRPVEPKSGSHALGLLMRGRSLDAARKDNQLMQMMAGIMSMTDIHRLQLNPHTIPYEETRRMDKDASAIPPMIKEGLCEALIVQGEHDERDLAFLAERMPVVSLGRIYPTLPVDAAVADNIAGVRGLVKHLVELGHRRLAWLGAGYKSSFMEARQLGFIQGCLDHKLDLGQQCLVAPELSEKVEVSVDTVLDAVKAGVSGVVCGNDALALRMIEALQAVGLRVPDEVSVTSFDHGFMSLRPWHITSVDPHFFLRSDRLRLALPSSALGSRSLCPASSRCAAKS